MSKSFKKIRKKKKKAEKSFCLENSTFHALSKNIDQAFQVSPLMMTVETLFTSSLKKITDFCSNYLSRWLHFLLHSNKKQSVNTSKAATQNHPFCFMNSLNCQIAAVQKQMTWNQVISEFRPRSSWNIYTGGNKNNLILQAGASPAKVIRAAARLRGFMRESVEQKRFKINKKTISNLQWILNVIEGISPVWSEMLELDFVCQQTSTL